MLGYNTENEIMLWVQTKTAAKIQYKYWEKGQMLAPNFSEVQETQQANAFSVKTLLQNLKPQTTYEYAVLVDGKMIVEPKWREFKTQALQNQIIDFKVATGSCANIRDKSLKLEGWEKSLNTAWGYSIFNAIAKRKPDYMIWLGDYIYLRNKEYESLAGFHYRYTYTRSYPKMQNLLKVPNHLATWDDHEYNLNNGNKNSSSKDFAKEAFETFWCNPPSHPQGKKGIYFNYRISDAEFFLTDDRYFRSPDDEKDEGEKTFFGKEQLDWLVESLKKSEANFKIICVGTQVLNTNQNMRGEGYMKMYPTEYNYFMNQIIQNKIEGVMFLTGDVHHSVLSKYQPEGFYPLYDWTVSAFTSIINPFFAKKNKRKVWGTFYGAHNFGEMSFSGTGESRTMRISVRNKWGWKVWKRDIRASDLKIH